MAGDCLNAVRGIDDRAGVLNPLTYMLDIVSRIALPISSCKSLLIAIQFRILSVLGLMGIAAALEKYLNTFPNVGPPSEEYSLPGGLPNDISQSLEKRGEVPR